MVHGNIYLIGFMGSGKSAVSREISEKYGYTTVEMDEEIVKEAGKPITRIFAEEGEEGFRQMETELLAKLAGTAGQVVSCGGGTALREENVSRMRESGTIILLKASPETIYERVKKSKDRPLLNGNMNVEYIEELMGKRKKAYEQAAQREVETDQKSVKEIAGEIMKIIEENSE